MNKKQQKLAEKKTEQAWYCGKQQATAENIGKPAGNSWKNFIHRLFTDLFLNL